MMVERRPRAAAPLCDLGLVASLRQRRRHGRFAYLIALFSGREATRAVPATATVEAQGGLRVARTR
jgi:hypothetical protein